ncbi:M23 family metallopeptidase [Streptacidiphilus griseoplanus]|uniref:M23 family metallopeptidase n=1 Tax=Peterkaempfera griseoplana TaxID=66896 RepID=UPI000B1ED421|nr:LysM peptidoglycan-binding domain-containing M23 family metallopeptidase [Peterkaempfera griseoplana]
MASEGRHRRPRSTSATTAHRLVLAAGVTGAGLGVPVAAVGGRPAPHHPAESAAGGRADSPGEDMQNASFTGTLRLPAPSAGTPSSARPKVHVVAPGETLSGIARSNRVPGGWRSVYLDNREVIGDDPDLVRPGERLRIDPPAAHGHQGAAGGQHVVRRGESLSSIAEAEDVDGGWQSIYLDNREVIGGDPDLIRPGQRLDLPAPGTAGAAKPKAAAAREPAARKPSARRPAAQQAAAKAPAARKPAARKPAGATPAHRPHSAAHGAGTAAAHATLPVHGYTLTAGYRAAGSHWAHRHTGQDFAVPSGTPVSAVLTGTVVTAGWGGAYGNEVVLRHHDGSYTVYAHLSSIAVRRGETVTAGARLGRSGATGNVTGPHLHFEVRNAPGYGADIDPVAWLERHGLHI